MLDSWYGILVFLLFDLIAFVAVVAITYHWFFKRILDVLISGICIVFLSPIYLILFIRARSAKKRGEIEKTVVKTKYIGKKGKTVYLSRYALNPNALWDVYAFIDVFFGKLSFIGCLPFRPSDATFLDADEEERHRAKPGLINPLVIVDEEEIEYDEIVANDVRYAERFSLGKDCKIFFTWLLKKIRGEGKGYLGEANEKNYARSLVDDNRISTEEYENALKADLENEEV